MNKVMSSVKTINPLVGRYGLRTSNNTKIDAYTIRENTRVFIINFILATYEYDYMYITRTITITQNGCRNGYSSTPSFSALMCVCLTKCHYSYDYPLLKYFRPCGQTECCVSEGFTIIKVCSLWFSLHRSVHAATVPVH